MLSPDKPPEIIDAALQVAGLGLRVHPLIGKRPLWDDWPALATADCRVVERVICGRNYGIVCDEIAVIDTDTPELAAWWSLNMPKTTWSVKTPHGGVHYYYRSLPGLRNAVKVDRGWDVRAGGRGYVVGHGSVVDGKTYGLGGEPTLDLPPFDPAWLPKSAEPLALPKTAFPPRGRIRDLQAYIRKILSIQGQRGSDACFRVACVLRDEGLSPEEALAYMLEWNRTSAIPPWSLRELEKKIRDAFAKAMKGE
jgi:hypothetical protein